MVSAAVVADGHNRVIPLPPEFIGPQSDPAAADPELDAVPQAGLRAQRRQARSRLPALPPRLGTVLLPSYLPAPTTIPTSSSSASPPLTSACRTSCTSPCTTPPAGSACATPSGNSASTATAGRAACRCATVPTPCRASRKAADGKGWEQTYYNTFFTSLEVTPDRRRDRAGGPCQVDRK